MYHELCLKTVPFIFSFHISKLQDLLVEAISVPTFQMNFIITPLDLTRMENTMSDLANTNFQHYQSGPQRKARLQTHTVLATSLLQLH